MPAIREVNNNRGSLDRIARRDAVVVGEALTATMVELANLAKTARRSGARLPLTVSRCALLHAMLRANAGLPGDKSEEIPVKQLIASALVATCAVLTLPAGAACPTDAAVDAYLADFVERRPSQGFGNDISYEDAECAKRKLGSQLGVALGDLVGYKAGMTNPALQQRFGVSGPKWGYMFDRNFVDIIAQLPHDFGARPLYEADLIVEVKDAGLADAKTPLEALAFLESVVPFIELPDLMLVDGFSGANFVATNLAFRGGVLGMEVPVQPTQEFADALAAMSVVMVDDADGGRELGRGQGSALMGHPLNAAIWLARELKKDGIVLKKGDLLSLGGFFPPQPTRPGMKVRMRYIGLPGDPELTVEFN